MPGPFCVLGPVAFRPYGPYTRGMEDTTQELALAKRTERLEMRHTQEWGARLDRYRGEQSRAAFIVDAVDYYIHERYAPEVPAKEAEDA